MSEEEHWTFTSYQYVDWIGTLSRDPSIVEYCVVTHGSDQQETKRSMLLQLETLAQRVSNRFDNALPQAATGADLLSTLLFADQPWAISASVRGDGLVGLSVVRVSAAEDEHPLLTTDLEVADNIALVFSHLLKRAFGESIDSVEIGSEPASEEPRDSGEPGASHTQSQHLLYEPAFSDPQPIPLKTLTTDCHGGKRTCIDRLRVVAKDCAATVLQEYRSQALRSDFLEAPFNVASDPVAALAHRRLTVRNQLVEAIDIHHASFSNARPMLRASAELGLSITGTVGAFLGVLFAATVYQLGPFQALRGFSPAIGLVFVALGLTLHWSRTAQGIRALGNSSVSTSQEGGTSNAESAKARIGSFIRLAGFGVAATIIVLSKAEGWWTTASYCVLVALVMPLVGKTVVRLLADQISRQEIRQSNQRSTHVYLTLGLAAIASFAATFLLGLFVPTGIAEFHSHHLQQQPLLPMVLDSDEVGLFGAVLLVIAAGLYLLCLSYQNRANRVLQIITRPRRRSSSEERDDRVQGLSDSRDRLLHGSNWGPSIVLMTGVFFLLHSIGSESALGDASPTKKGGVSSEHAALFFHVLSDVGWALPLLALGLLAQSWNRFGQSGTLTLIHDAAIGRLSVVRDLIRNDERLVRTLERDMSKKSEVASESRPAADLIRVADLTHEVNLTQSHIDSLNVQKDSVRSDFLQRSALVAAVVFALLQVDPLKRLEPNTFEQASATDVKKLHHEVLQLQRSALEGSDAVRIHVLDPTGKQLPVKKGDIHFTIGQPPRHTQEFAAIVNGQKVPAKPTDDGVIKLDFRLPSQRPATARIEFVNAWPHPTAVTLGPGDTLPVVHLPQFVEVDGAEPIFVPPNRLELKVHPPEPTTLRVIGDTVHDGLTEPDDAQPREASQPRAADYTLNVHSKLDIKVNGASVKPQDDSVVLDVAVSSHAPVGPHSIPSRCGTVGHEDEQLLATFYFPRGEAERLLCVLAPALLRQPNVPKPHAGVRDGSNACRGAPPWNGGGPLARSIGELITNGTQEFLAVGLTDSTGRVSGNIELSRRRADFVRAWVKKAVPLARPKRNSSVVLGSIGRGEEAWLDFPPRGPTKALDSPESRRVELRMCNGPTKVPKPGPGDR